VPVGEHDLEEWVAASRSLSTQSAGDISEWRVLVFEPLEHCSFGVLQHVADRVNGVEPVADR
jgi:hypothetical protein